MRKLTRLYNNYEGGGCMSRTSEAQQQCAKSVLIDNNHPVYGGYYVPNYCVQDHLQLHVNPVSLCKPKRMQAVQ